MSLLDIMPAMKIAIDQLAREQVPSDNLKYAAALLIGQALTESGLNPNAIHDNNTGYGIYGARLERKDAMWKWLKDNSYPENSLEGQVRYMVIEAMAKPICRQSLLTATSYNQPLGNFILTHFFEAPKIENLGTRLKNTKKALLVYELGGVGSVS
jgi:hypothetical protein